MFATPTQSQTLSQRIAAGKIPAAEALHYATLLAEELHRMHGQGQVHGGLSTATVMVGGARVVLLPAPAGAGITPYSAPEVILGRPADARSDVFSFGALLFEMVTGRQAFAGSNPKALAEAITSAPAPSSGSPALDQLLRHCLAKDPAARYQRMHRVALEVKLLASAVRRAQAAPQLPLPAQEPAAPLTVPAAPPAADTAAWSDVRAQVSRIETRVSAQIEVYERRLAEVERAAADAMAMVRQQLSTASLQLAGTRDYLSTAQGAGRSDDSVLANLKHSLESLTLRVSRLEQTVNERMQRFEQGLDQFDQDGAALRDSVTDDLRRFDRAIKNQTAAIESARTALAQTDDLVERVVEALESLQSVVIQPAEENRPVPVAYDTVA